MNDRVGEPVDDLAAVGPVAGARRTIRADEHSAILIAESGKWVIW
jgi:hypothetical protein